MVILQYNGCRQAIIEEEKGQEGVGEGQPTDLRRSYPPRAGKDIHQGNYTQKRLQACKDKRNGVHNDVYS